MKTAEALAQRRWYVVDARGKILGRMATEIARVLRGKHKPVFTPNVDAGDFVIVINARGIKLSGKKLDKKVYSKELAKLHLELVKLQEWIKHQGLKVVVLFEGRDAAGKGGVIKRITECLNPRVCRVVALAAPTEREKTQWYFQP